MPYIYSEYRTIVDFKLDSLINDIKNHLIVLNIPPDKLNGVLNYIITKIVIENVYEKYGKVNYNLINDINGIFDSASKEFYNRIGQPYEEYCRNKNGDLDIYKKINEDISQL